MCRISPNGRSIWLILQTKQLHEFRLAVSLFKSAQDGERDRAQLKQRTLAAIAGIGADRSAQAH